VGSVRQVSGHARGWTLPVAILLAAMVILPILGYVGYRVATGMFGVVTAQHDWIPVDVTVQLTPDATGTRVQVTERARRGNLPSSVDLGFITSDNGRETDGGSLSGATLTYSDPRDSAGRLLPSDQLARGHLRVPTSRGEVRYSYHVDSVGGRRVIYPVADSTVMAWATMRIPPTGVTCLTEDSMSEPTDRLFRPCTPSASILDDHHNSNMIRLELP
jgi:hypothetical protein